MLLLAGTVGAAGGVSIPSHCRSDMRPAAARISQPAWISQPATDQPVSRGSASQPRISQPARLMGVRAPPPSPRTTARELSGQRDGGHGGGHNHAGRPGAAIGDTCELGGRHRGRRRPTRATSAARGFLRVRIQLTKT